jgi:hypothetical protein
MLLLVQHNVWLSHYVNKQQIILHFEMRPKHSQINLLCFLCTNEQIHCKENAKQPQQGGGGWGGVATKCSRTHKSIWMCFEDHGFVNIWVSFICSNNQSNYKPWTKPLGFFNHKEYLYCLTLGFEVIIHKWKDENCKQMWVWNSPISAWEVKMFLTI